MKAIILAALMIFPVLACSQDKKQEIPVLMYHQITNDKPAGETVISVSNFGKQMELLHRNGYKTITASELTNFLNGKISLPPKTVALTFDDGWKSTLNAVRILDSYNFSSTFYVVSGFSQHADYLTNNEILWLSHNPRFEIGAHSHTHFLEWTDNLDKIDSRTMAGEIIMSKILIESMIGKKVNSYAWPFGFVKDDVMKMTSSMGFTSTMLVTPHGKNSVGMSPLRTHRINIDGRCNMSDFEEMLQTKLSKACNDETNKATNR